MAHADRVRKNSILPYCRSHVFTAYILFLFFLSLFIYFERASRVGAERKGGERQFQAGSTLSAQSLMQGSSSQTTRSWPEPRSRVRCSTDWATQAPLTAFKTTWCWGGCVTDHRNPCCLIFPVLRTSVWMCRWGQGSCILSIKFSLLFLCSKIILRTFIMHLPFLKKYQY